MEHNQTNPTNAEILNIFSKENKPLTKEFIKNQFKFVSDTVINKSLDFLVNKGLITVEIDTKDNNKSIYKYTEPLKDNIIILEGDLLLPVTIITKDDGRIFVTRGKWYEFPKGFDTRRIVWNCALNNNGNEKNRTLVDMLTSAGLSQKKSTIVQLPEYESFINKTIKYNDDITLLIHKVGEELTEISVIFNILVGPKTEDLTVYHSGFKIKSEIATDELVNEVFKDAKERDFTNIKLRKIYELSDLIYVGNQIPVAYVDGNLRYINIITCRRKLQYAFLELKEDGSIIHHESELFDVISEGIEAIMELCEKFVNNLFNKNGFLLD